MTMHQNKDTSGRAVQRGQLLPTEPHDTAAIIVANETVRRGLEEVISGLGLKSKVLTTAGLDEEDLSRYELVIAEEAVARQLRPILNDQQREGEEIKPALIAVGSRKLLDETEKDGEFDGVLGLPASQTDLASRLSVVLYSHRALAQRYQSALEELNLNRNIFRSVSNGITVSNAQMDDMPLLYVNPAFEMMSGYTLEEVENKNCRFLQGDDRDQPGLTLIREAIAQQRQTTAILRNYRKDGTCFWNELTLSPIFNRDKVLTHFVGIQQDVSERVNMESALRESEKLAAVGRLASSISHEINNPLEALMNLLYIVRHMVPRTEESREAHDYLEAMDEELKRVKLIAAQSLRFYKQSTGPETLLASSLIESVLNLYHARLLNYGVEVKLRQRSTQHIVGLGSELRQVLSNLVSNALDATKSLKGTGTILLRTREAARFRNDQSGILMTIADNGSGMSEETQRKLYKAFFTTKGISGTGLGLWISKEIIARHHGHLKFRSSTAEGRSYTVFQLFLPYQGASGTAPSSKFGEG